MDETQRLTNLKNHSVDKIEIATTVLERIHNGDLGNPTILVAAGLGGLADTFSSLGISRYAKICYVELDALSKKAERAVIQDWLKIDGQAHGDPTEWIDAITMETHGWPQHIVSYAEPATKQLNLDHGVMTVEGLQVVMKEGREEREVYYEGRGYEFDEEERQSITRSISRLPLGASATKETIMSVLTQDYRRTDAEKLFRRALSKGLLDRREERYAVPIPPMHNWLVTNYARD